MRVVIRGLAAVTVVSLALSAGGCGSPTGPTNGPNFTVAVSGPSRVAPGQVARFTATAYYPGNVVRDVTNDVQWFVSPQTLSVAEGGAVSGRSHGEGTVSAQMDGRIGRADVLVLPTGTYRLRVRVLVEGSQSEGLSGATIGVTNEDGTEVVVTGSGQGGYYFVYGVRGPAELQVTHGKPYYEATTQRINVTGDGELEVRVRRLNPPLDLTGAYTLTIAASQGCADVLPEGMRVRSYSAVLEPLPTWRYVVRVQDTSLLDGRNVFDGSILSADMVEFHLDWAWDGPIDPSLIERLPESDFLLGIGGVAATTVGPDGTSGTLDGEFQVLSWPQRARLATCQATDHTFTLTRQ